MDKFTWINPDCNSHNPDWYERKFPDELENTTHHYNRTYRIKETFPVEFNDIWNVKQQGRIVETWTVTDIHPKKTNFTVSIYEDRPFE